MLAEPEAAEAVLPVILLGPGPAEQQTQVVAVVAELAAAAAAAVAAAAALQPGCCPNASAAKQALS